MSALERWQAVAQTPDLLGFFSGLFDRIGVRVVDTGEEFVCTQTVDRIELTPGMADDVDFVVEITTEQVDRLGGEAATGRLSDLEKYRVLRTMLGTPLEYTASLMNNRVLSNPTVRRLLRVVDTAHIHFRSPSTDEPDEEYTLEFRDGAWKIEQGLHGTAERTIELDVDSTLEFHRQTLAFKKDPGAIHSLRYVAWYVPWRRRVSSRVSK